MSGPAGFRAGFGVGSVAHFEPGKCLFGWGDPAQVPDGVDMPLSARALALEEAETGRRLVYVVCDLGMISESVRRAVVERVCTPEHGLNEHGLLLTATHTHSGPGGYSAYPFYSISMPGVSATTHDGIVTGIASAVTAALARLRPARLWFHQGFIPAAEPVAFNRSILAYNRNEDATPVTAERSDEAVERVLSVLRVDDENAVPLGVVSWFAVHGTSLHSQQRRLHGDNKGYAAEACESWAREQGFSGFAALFSQESAGDVSPNYRFCPTRQLMVGRYENDAESARFNGEIQERRTRELWRAAPREGTELHGPLDFALRYRDFFDLRADARFARQADARTAPPRIGIGFMVGTLEGHGPFYALRKAFPWLRRAQALNVGRATADSWRVPHGVKVPFLDFSGAPDAQFLGLFRTNHPALRLFAHDFARDFRSGVAWSRKHAVSWVPRYLPVQQLRIGQLVIGALPNEPTTVAGRRLRTTLLSAWAGSSVTHAIALGYCNAYCGYLTTPEEYEEQAYEGASNLYGRWSLPVFCSELWQLAAEMRRGRGQHSLGHVPPNVPLSWERPARGKRGVLRALVG